MTAARQKRKPAFYVGWPLWPWHGYFRTLWPLGSLFGALESRPATDNQLAVNATTGLAISSFDPVACFSEGKALFGRPEFELNLDGAVWRFSNGGNRGAFEKHRDVYAPCFAGYDPVAIGRGRSGPGIPLSGPSPVNDFISSIASRRALLSSPIRAASSIPRSANGPTSPGTWDSKLRQ